ncbi:MAG: hypothetical protein JRH19_27580, partial [Deltaproteobacteria bacterium]|nr:hypothetical protein [Deltaproteobacteria bacterium]
MHRLLPIVLTLCAALPLTARATLDYHHWSEGYQFLAAQSFQHEGAQLYGLGPTSLPGIAQWALKIGADPGVEDAGQRNAVLFECGMHAREWFAVESCYALIQHLLDNYT